MDTIKEIRRFFSHKFYATSIFQILILIMIMATSIETSNSILFGDKVALRKNMETNERNPSIFLTKFTLTLR